MSRRLASLLLCILLCGVAYGQPLKFSVESIPIPEGYSSAIPSGASEKMDILARVYDNSVGSIFLYLYSKKTKGWKRILPDIDPVAVYSRGKISSNGSVALTINTSQGNIHYLYRKDSFSPLIPPKSAGAEVASVNRKSTVLYEDCSYVSKGQLFDSPVGGGSHGVRCHDLNDKGMMIGDVTFPEDGEQFGFIYDTKRKRLQTLPKCNGVPVVPIKFNNKNLLVAYGTRIDSTVGLVSFDLKTKKYISLGYDNTIFTSLNDKGVAIGYKEEPAIIDPMMINKNGSILALRDLLPGDSEFRSNSLYGLHITKKGHILLSRARLEFAEGDYESDEGGDSEQFLLLTPSK